MRILKYTSLLVVWMFAFPAHSQSTFFSEYNDIPPFLITEQMVSSLDGTYFASFGLSSMNRTRGMIFLETDARGNFPNGKFFGLQDEFFRINAAVATQDGGYAIAGVVGVIGHQDVFALKLRRTGSIQWKKRFSVESNSRESINTMIEVPDGFLLVGTHHDHNDFKDSVLLIKMDQNGNLRWKRRISGTESIFESLAALSLEQGVVAIAAGYYRGTLLIGINSNGKVLWARNFYFPGNFTFHSPGSILQTSDGGFLLASPSSRDIYVGGMNVLKINPSRRLVWHKFFRSSADSLQVQDVTGSADGGFVMTGFLRDLSLTSDSAFVAKIDPEGAVQWKRQLNRYDRSRFMAVTGFPDGTIGLSGAQSSLGGGGALLARLSAKGQVSNSCDVFRGLSLKSLNIPTFQANILIQSHSLPKSTKTWPLHVIDFEAQLTPICPNQ